MGCSRENPHPNDGWDSGNSCRRGGGGGGSKTLEIQAEGQVELEKVFCRGQDTKRKSRRKIVATKSLKSLTHFYSYPDPARAPLSNFMLAPLKSWLLTTSLNFPSTVD